jgi:hypothetical protein
VLKVCEFLAKKSVTKMDYSPYSPELAPYEVYSAQNLKNNHRRDIDLPAFLASSTM